LALEFAEADAFGFGAAAKVGRRRAAVFAAEGAAEERVFRESTAAVILCIQRIGAGDFVADG
jgi:hypothetical protein